MGRAPLISTLESIGGTVTRSTRLVRFVDGPDGVIATLERDGESFEVAADWLLGSVEVRPPRLGHRILDALNA